MLVGVGVAVNEAMSASLPRSLVDAGRSSLRPIKIAFKRLAVDEAVTCNLERSF